MILIVVARNVYCLVKMIVPRRESFSLNRIESNRTESSFFLWNSERRRRSVSRGVRACVCCTVGDCRFPHFCALLPTAAAAVFLVIGAAKTHNNKQRRTSSSFVFVVVHNELVRRLFI